VFWLCCWLPARIDRRNRVSIHIEAATYQQQRARLSSLSPAILFLFPLPSPPPATPLSTSRVVPARPHLNTSAPLLGTARRRFCPARPSALRLFVHWDPLTAATHPGCPRLRIRQHDCALVDSDPSALSAADQVRSALPVLAAEADLCARLQIHRVGNTHAQYGQLPSGTGRIRSRMAAADPRFLPDVRCPAPRDRERERWTACADRTAELCRHQPTPAPSTSSDRGTTTLPPCLWNRIDGWGVTSGRQS